MALHGHIGAACEPEVTKSLKSSRLWDGEAATFIKDNCDAFEYLGLDRDPINASKGRVVTTSTIRADGYSNDLNAMETTGL